ncbi:heterokaryon incompatibility protein-domain-containing protein [Xylariaceae sp. FL1272]|nr:heterokaryon incompatibility protein-domain-containing protein [Xylariaceae sp. FL1272]
MAGLLYTSLCKDRNEIRLVTILPGDTGDPMLLEICHSVLPATAPLGDSQFSTRDVEAVQRTLPDHWVVKPVIDDGLLFIDYEKQVCTYQHPDPTFKLGPRQPIEIQHTPTPNYEALSYCWGDTSLKTAVGIRPRDLHSCTEQTNRLMVGENLSDALRYLRSPSQPRTLWIDAICINQSDKEERAQQVARMCHIFSRSARVVAWIGPGSPTVDLVFSTLTYLGKQVEMLEYGSYAPRPGCDEPSWCHPSTHLPYDQRTWDAIEGFLGYDWFRRLWVVQEIKMGPRNAIIKCGAMEMKWSLFRRAILIILAKRGGVPSRVNKACRPLIEMCRYNHTTELLSLLGAMGKKTCVDERDRIYGLLNLLPPDLTPLIEVNYSKSTHQVFKDFICARIRQVRRLEFFQYCSLDQNSPSSWVPGKWSYPLAPAPAFVCFRACGMSATAATTNAEYLHISGVPIGSVSAGRIIECPSLYDVFRFLKSMGLKQLETEMYPNGRKLVDVYLSTLVLGLVKERLPWAEDFPSLSELRSELLGVPGADKPKREWKFSHDWKEMYSFCLGEKIGLFHTEEGYIGACSCDLQPGDRIYVALGCYHPLLLRPAADSTFRVLGECLVAGFMDDEAVLGPLPRPWRLVVLSHSDGHRRHYYLNEETGIEAEEDPRMTELPSDWEYLNRSRTPNDPVFFAWYRNKVTGEEINSDPRLLPDALRKRGVDVQTITLI